MPVSKAARGRITPHPGKGERLQADVSKRGIRKPSGWLIPSALPGGRIAGGLVDDFDLLIAEYRWLLSQPSAQCARCGEDGYV